jgi:hypothetical protein
MRTSLAFVLLASAAACGNSQTGDDDVTPDGGDNLPPPPERGFRITSPDIEIPANTEITYCYYFKTPNTEPLAINHWKSVMTEGSHHMIMFQTGSEAMPEGTVSAQNCGIGGTGTNVSIWTYAAQNAEAELALPSDDGTGKPLAQDVAASSPAYFQMHYFNPNDTPITAHVVVDALALDAGVAYTKTAPYVTFNGNINIPAGATNDVESNTCNTPANTKFWLMSTHAHKQAIKTVVRDGNDTMFESFDWEHPGAKTFMTPDKFFTFSSGKLTYECTYNNPTNRTITTGDSADTDEMCMASGYFFPATKPVFCYNNFIVPL